MLCGRPSSHDWGYFDMLGRVLFICKVYSVIIRMWVMALFWATNYPIINHVHTNYSKANRKRISSIQECAFLFPPNVAQFYCGFEPAKQPRCRSPPCFSVFASNQKLQSGGKPMAKVNLKDLYPHYRVDIFIEIPDDVLEVIKEHERQDETSKRYARRFNANFSFDVENPRNLEAAVLDKPVMPDDAFEKKVMQAYLYQAITQLSDKQASRLFSHFFLGQSYSVIARAEGVSETAIRASVEQGVRKLRYYLTNIL